MNNLRLLYIRLKKKIANTIIFTTEFQIEVGMLDISIGSNRTQQYFDDNIKTWLDERMIRYSLFMDWGRFIHLY